MWDHVSVRWPWWDIDADCEFVHWKEVVALGSFVWISGSLVQVCR